MTDFSGSHPEGGIGGRSSHGETLRADTAGSGPARPLGGSSLDALVRRQSDAPGAERRLGFVPAQVR